MFRVRRPTTVLVAALALAFTGAAEARADAGVTVSGSDHRTRLFVAPSGSDTADGTRSAPLRTPQLAVDRLGSDGGTVVLSSGTYPRQRIVLTNRHNVTVTADDGAVPVLDAAGLTPPGGPSGVVQITDGDRITVHGLTITGYRTRATAPMPIGIYVTGAAKHVSLTGNHVHHLGNDNPTLGSFEMNAHGIAVYGRNPTSSVSDLLIAGNEVDHLVLGASEAVVVNGNVDGWAITDNSIHDDNNIGIDAIGYEPTLSGAARYTEADRARHGVIARNTVTGIVSEGNPAYWEDGQWCNCADGIYVDGGESIAIDRNTVTRADIGIEVAAEDGKGAANDVAVTGNVVTGSKYVGLAMGGYDTERGEAYDVQVTGNTFRGNNTLDDGSPEILLQYYLHQVTITGNSVTATNADLPALVQRVAAAGAAAKNADVVLDRNDYGAPVPADRAAFVWLGTSVTGFSAWREASGQDRHSTYSRR